MLRTQSFAHGAFSARIRSQGVKAPSVGENLAWGVGSFSRARTIVAMWMASPEHRANLLKGEWREIGLSAVHVTSAPGAFNGLEVTIVTADFGVRR